MSSMWCLIIDESCLRIAGETTITACRPSADARSDAELIDLIIFSANALSSIKPASPDWRTIWISICSNSELSVMTGRGWLSGAICWTSRPARPGRRASADSLTLRFLPDRLAKVSRIRLRSLIGIRSARSSRRMPVRECSGISLGTTDCTKLGAELDKLSKRACTSSCPSNSPAYFVIIWLT